MKDLANQLLKLAELVLDIKKTVTHESEHDRLASILAYRLRQLQAQINEFLKAEAGDDQAKDFNVKPLQSALEEASKSLRELMYTSIHVKFAGRTALKSYTICPKLAPALDGVSLDSLDVPEESKEATRKFQNDLQKKFGDFQVRVFGVVDHNGICEITGDAGNVVKVSLYNRQ